MTARFDALQAPGDPQATREAARRACPQAERAHAVLGRIDGCTRRLLAAGRDAATLPDVATRLLEAAARGEQVPPDDLARALAAAGALSGELTHQVLRYANPHSHRLRRP